jgi:hypothetical protein
VGAVILASTAPAPWPAPLLALAVGGLAIGLVAPARARSPWLAVAAIVLGGAIAAAGPPSSGAAGDPAREAAVP